VHLKERHAPVGGTLLAFTEDFLLTDRVHPPAERHTSWGELPILQNPEEKQSLSLTPADQEFLTNLMNQMLAEYKKDQYRPDRFARGMLESYLHIFLLFLSRLYQRQFDTGSTFADRSLLRRFYVSTQEGQPPASFINASHSKAKDFSSTQTYP